MFLNPLALFPMQRYHPAGFCIILSYLRTVLEELVFAVHTKSDSPATLSNVCQPITKTTMPFFLLSFFEEFLDSTSNRIHLLPFIKSAGACINKHTSFGGLFVIYVLYNGS